MSEELSSKRGPGPLIEHPRPLGPDLVGQDLPALAALDLLVHQQRVEPVGTREGGLGVEGGEWKEGRHDGLPSHVSYERLHGLLLDDSVC